MGNLEQPLTDETGSSKCGSPARPDRFAFRSPPSYGVHLKEAGFDLVNLADNHAGFRNTRAPDAAGVQYTGAEDEITVVAIKVAVVGFSPYAGANHLNDLPHSRRVIQRAKEQSDVVVVQVHMGAEGAAMQHLKPGAEIYCRENRGDSIAFSHAVIDAGGDLVTGHSPQVLRANECGRTPVAGLAAADFADTGATIAAYGSIAPRA